MAVKPPEHGSIPPLRNGEKPPSPPFQPHTPAHPVHTALQQLGRQQIDHSTALERLTGKLEQTNHTVSELAQRVAQLTKTAQNARLAALCATGALLGYCRGSSRKGLLAGAVAGAAAATLWNRFNQAQEEIGPF
jgi:hypothetical protein